MRGLWVKFPLAYSAATAAGRADLKGSAKMPPLRQAAIPLGASGRERGGESRENLNVKPKLDFCSLHLSIRNMIRKVFKTSTAVANSGAMEADTISKTGGVRKAIRVGVNSISKK